MRNKIEFGELRLGEVSRQNLLRAHQTSLITAGSFVRQFEAHWGKLFDYPFNLGVSSGTDACLNACLSLYDFGAEPGDDIITPALSFIASANAIWFAGFKPNFVDIDRRTLNIDPDKIEAAISEKTQAIQVVHTMGRPCEMGPIMEIARKYNLRVLEDCCEAHGAKYEGQFVGKFGHSAAFSFYAAHLVCSAEGGMVSTMHSDVADVVRSTRSHGRRDGELYFDFPRHGLNSKMNDLEAAVGLEGIGQFWETFQTRLQTVRRLREATADFRHLAYFSEEDEDNVNCPHGFSITMREAGHAALLKACLSERSIHWKRNFGSVPTQHGAFAHFGYKLGAFPEAEFVGTNGLHIGVHQHLPTEDVDYVCGVLRSFFKAL